MAVRPKELLYSVDETPPLPRLLALGLQYAVLAAVYLIFIVLVARRAGAGTDVARDLVGLGLVALAVGVVVQAWRGRFFGSGYLAPPSYSAIYFVPSLIAAKVGGLAAVAGMTIFAGVVEIVLSALLVRLRVVFQPTISGFTVFVVGIQLGLVGIGNTLDVAGENLADFHAHVGIAVLTLAACIGFTIWGRGVWRLVSTLLGLGIGVAAAFLAGIVEPTVLSAVEASPWFALPNPSVISWGFDVSLVPAFVAAGVAATIRTIGTLTTAERVNDASWKRPDMDNLRRGVAADGIGCVVSGLLGGLGMTIAPSLVGVSSATGATSRSIAWVSAAFLILLALTPKLGAAVIALPLGVAGAILVFASSFMIVSGIQIMAVHGLDLRAGFAISIALFVGLLTSLNPGYFAEFPAGVQTVTSDMLTVSLATAIGLTLLFRIGIRQKDATEWRTADGSLTDFHALLDKEALAWKLSEELLDRARETIESIVARLTGGHYLTEPVKLAASYDQLELAVEMTYRGRPLQLFARQPIAEPHEESAASGGIEAFSLGNRADRIAVHSDADTVTIKLWFGT